MGDDGRPAEELYTHTVLWHLTGHPKQRTILQLSVKRRSPDGYYRRYVAVAAFKDNSRTKDIVIDDVKIRRIDE